MFGSVILEVLIALSFIYFILSLVCMAVNEKFSSIMQYRSKELKDGLISMLDDPHLVEKLYNHPLIFGLWKSRSSSTSPIDFTRETRLSSEQTAAATAVPSFTTPTLSKIDRLPSYIPSRQLASALIDMLNTSRAFVPQTIDSIRDNIQNLPPGQFKETIMVIAKNATDLNDLSHKLECWFDDGMDRVSGWYTRKVQQKGLIIACLITITFNIDTIQIATNLYHDTAFRLALSSNAIGYLNSGATIQSAQGTEIGTLLHNLNLPLGWSQEKFPTECWGWLNLIFSKLVGFSITTASITIGAPFWFDVLNKVANIRLAGNKPDKSPKSCS